MSTDEVFQKTARALAEVLGLDEEEVQADSRLVGDLEATSLDVVDLLFQLKKTFDIDITLAQVQRELTADSAAGGEAEGGYNDAIFESVTVQHVADWVKSRLAA